MEKKTIAIIAAQKGELEYLISLLQNKQKILYGKYVAYEGIIEEKNVILLCTGVGIVNTAVATTLLLQNKKIDYIINEGTAGAHKYELNINDIIIGEECIHINSYKTAKLQKGIEPKQWKLMSFISDSEDKLIVYKADKNLINIANKVEYIYGTKITGRLGSGDIWNREADRIKWFSESYNTMCEDMESIGIYTIANDMNIPVIGIRIISNNESRNIEFEKSTEINCQKFVYEMIKKI